MLVFNVSPDGGDCRRCPLPIEICGQRQVVGDRDHWLAATCGQQRLVEIECAGTVKLAITGY